MGRAGPGHGQRTADLALRAGAARGLATRLPLPVASIAHVARSDDRPLLAAYRAIRGEPLTEERLRELPRVLGGLLTAREIADLDACLARYERVTQPQMAPCALLHGDLKPAHVLHDAAGGQITGVPDWGDVSLGDHDFDLAVIGIFLGHELLARLLEHLPDRDPAVMRDKARFFTTLRHLQDVRYDLDHGDAATVRRAVDLLREHLRDH